MYLRCKLVKAFGNWTILESWRVQTEMPATRGVYGLSRRFEFIFS